MKPSRRAQPYRKGRRAPTGPTANAMKRGKPFHMPNPQDRKRRTAKRAGMKRRRMRRLYYRTIRR